MFQPHCPQHDAWHHRQADNIEHRLVSGKLDQLVVGVADCQGHCRYRHQEPCRLSRSGISDAFFLLWHCPPF